MHRSIARVAAAIALVAGPAYAADLDLRPAYPEQWETDGNTLRFEAGLRYWMSWGGQDAGLTVEQGGVTFGDVNINSRDQSHIAEVHGRIDDLYTNTYLKAAAGVSLATSGTYSISPAGSGNIGNHSQIGYAVVDYGFMPFGRLDGPAAAGAFLGYAYWKDAPDIGTGQVAAAFDGAGNPTAYANARDDFNINALRLGLRGTAEAGMFDFQGEVAAVPYAHVSGVLGGSAPNGFAFPALGGATAYENSQTTLNGWGYGAMVEALVGFHPTENLTLRVGGRAWYLQGNLDAEMHNTVGGVAQPTITRPTNFASLFRYGALFELTGRF